ncbi:type I Iterative Polyketide synthase (PKS) [Aspergillus brasiliensis]|uniref:6-methylsalicylic acid synthase n=1 Tax=Aspergillus brasiliensis TaxID=319629 RepID=A0A9W5YLG5_9EURO|nr:type I Iterative Polyketide synthase (PKS) [Aspergillus brasiliensis]GKZ42266.1 type I Iterative Polyketide synthase (PKS) [Aspergillus brasiliensis]
MPASRRSSTKFSTPAEGSDNGKGFTTPATSTEGNDFSDRSEDALDDVAIIGMACRTPGDVRSPDGLWQYLLQKGDASGDLPDWRWEPYRQRHPRNAALLAQTTAKGYFLDDIEQFDAAFFSISPREAEQMDPQQRLALEVAWEALENAGISPPRLAGSNTSVYMGVNSDDYAKLLLEDLPNVGAHMGVGTAYCGIPSRISYILDLMGPSVALDAACASSLVAVHHARQAIRAGETDLAIAGGVNALLGPGLTRVLDEAGAISADGKCRSFDESASGYGRGEGAGAVILKRLDKALADGDHVLAVLKGSAVASDGKTLGIMAPNARAQLLVAHKALAEAKMSADSVNYVEAHATSTSLGDPTETNALAEVYGAGSGRSPSDPCYIGSIKPNIGHLEAGAGVMGLIKAVLVLRHGQVPPQANLQTLNSKIAWNENLLHPPRELVTLPCPGPSRALRAAVASYGYSGTVSHAVLEAFAGHSQFAERLSQIPAGDEPSPVLLLLSAPQASRVPAAAGALKQWLSQNEASISLKAISSTLAQRRAHHRYRHAIVADSVSDAIAALDDVSNEAPNRWAIKDKVSPGTAKGPVWVFSGHGAQWEDMGRELFESSPAFAEVVHNLEPIIQAELGFSAIETLQQGCPNRSDVVQAMTFLMHLGIAAILEIESGPPSAVVGHSLGEAAAAVVSGALTWREGALVVCRRARLYRDLMGQGAMALVRLSAEEACTRIGTQAGVWVAIETSATACVVSGEVDAVKQLSDQWREDGIEVRMVASDVPFHTPMLEKLAEPLYEALQGELDPRLPSRTLFSTSQPDPRSEVLRDAQYWVTNMVQPVRLQSAVTAIAQDGFRALVEVSSHPIVTHSVVETMSECTEDSTLVTPTMVRRQPALKNILAAAGRLHCFGCPIRYTDLDPSAPWSSSVPGSLWHHQPFYRVMSQTPTSQLETTHDPAANNLLGKRIALWGTDEVLYQTRLDEDNRPFPGHHPLHGSEIVPAAVLLRTFLQALAPRCVEQVSLQVPVVVSPARQVQIRHNTRNITITSRLEESNSQEDGSWLVNTTAAVGAAEVLPSQSHLDLSEVSKRLPQRLADSFSIDYLASVGVSAMGFPWQVIHHVASDDEMLAQVDANPENMGGMNDFLTSIMDAATSISSTLWHRDPQLRMPTSVRRVVAVRDIPIPRVVYIHCVKAESAGPYTADVTLTSADGTVFMEILGMAFASLEGESFSRKSTAGLVHRIQWPPAAFVEDPLEFTHIAFLTPDITNPRLVPYQAQLAAVGISTSVHQAASDLPLTSDSSLAVVYLPQTTTDVFDTAFESCNTLVSAAHAVNAAATAAASSARLFVLTSETDLGHSALSGLSRIIQTEHPDIWGGLIEVEDPVSFPLMAMRYVQNADVIKIKDGVPRVARLRPLPSSSSSATPLTFSPAATYLITGGLGALGLSVAKWMVTQGARRLLLLSRRALPPRRSWSSTPHATDPTIQSVLELESLGATIHCLSIDVSLPTGASTLQSTLDTLNLPPVAGVVHAAGVVSDQLVEQVTPDVLKSVLAPKIQGALNLHDVFPPASLDFFVLFSSCGQLLGFPGQASYASGNAFLDALARSRKVQGDNAISLLWTTWRGMGMGQSANGAMEAELYARGITDITPDDAFRAWTAVASAAADGVTDHGVIVRTRVLESGEPLPHPILKDIITRKVETVNAGGQSASSSSSEKVKLTGKELEQHLWEVIKGCVSKTLSVKEEEIDDSVALAEMGMDSVMTVNFRMTLQQTLKVPVGPTLVWKCPTVQHLVRHFMKELDV